MEDNRHFHRGKACDRICILFSAITMFVGCTTPFAAQPVGGAARPSGENPTVARSADLLMKRGFIGGIGAKLETTNGVLRIAGVLGDSPAERAGLKAGQAISAINGVSVANIRLDDAVKLLRGTPGTEVELAVVVPGSPSPRRIQLVREVIDVYGVKYRILESNVGLLTLMGFSEQTPGKVLEALEVFTRERVHGLVLDLRDGGGGGGLYTAATEVAGYFVGTGPLWLVRGVGELKAQPVLGKTDPVWLGPIVVLTSTNTGGSSELLVSALKSNRRATIMGETTAGTACLQELEKQADGTSRRVLRAQVFTVRNEKILGQGIKPDLPIAANVPPERVLSQGVEALRKLK